MWTVCTVTAIDKELGILVAGGKASTNVVVYSSVLVVSKQRSLSDLHRSGKQVKVLFISDK
jgi:hypothetical protein